ncbi:fructosamine kinase family protein [Vibrio sp. ZSDZ34]|uniref:Fructosamine kinase family protein n=1 Tax=Vibrio gelatinilyticus TaxID=2893468 RepID=A0A9X1WC44_9VIBR|nr:fructosamine kinase family protein [Vibrio gelatinilyticus]MCJ2376655.1 fructosamine kinase family protein [Vibrio gelatinilyticus]
MWQAISDQLSETLLFEFKIKERTKMLGGDINECYMISDGEQRYFVKINQKDFLPKFEIEALNLRALRETSTVSVPEVVLISTTKECSFIILNYIPVKPLDLPTESFLFGQNLAKLHKWGEQKEYGFDHDNYIGTTLQPNNWHKKWNRFFSDQRIGWQLQLLKEKDIKFVDIETFVELISDLLHGHNPKPSLLHGDLWHGNVAKTAFGPLCYDPASYWGDRECDLAMTELFGGFQPDFYEGYESILAIEPGYELRKDIYNLYHVLNHCQIFGGEYMEHAETLISKIQKSAL